MNCRGIQTLEEQDRILPAPLFREADPYVHFLRENGDRLFYLKPWNGNSGDLLIWRGTEHLFRCLGLNRTMDPRKAEILLIPGGNQTMWQDNIDIWNQVRSKYPDKAFVVGPTTVQMGVTRWDQDIRRAGARILAIFARDSQSYANLKNAHIDPGILIGLSHDPALCLRDSRWAREHRAAATEEFVLAAFRFDKEGVQEKMPHMEVWSRLLPRWLLDRVDVRFKRRNFNRKVSRMAPYVQSGKPLLVCDASKYQFEYFVEMIRSAAEVHTDRLHCMLLAAMLGKRVFAYPTAYAKLEQVYVHSIEGWARVEFVPGPRVRETGGFALGQATNPR